MSFPLLTPLLCYSYSFEKRTIESAHRDERGKEDGHGPFFRSGYLFFARTKVLNAHDFLDFSCLSIHATPIAFLLFFSQPPSLSPGFYKAAPMRSRNTKRWWPYFFGWRDFIFLDFLRQQNLQRLILASRSLLPPIGTKKKKRKKKRNPTIHPIFSSVPTTFFPGARSHGFFRSW